MSLCHLKRIILEGEQKLIDTKEKKEKNREQMFCLGSDQNWLKAHFGDTTKVVISNIKGIIIIGLIYSVYDLSFYC